MNERIYNKAIERLRSPERVSRFDLKQVIENSLTGMQAASVLDVGTGSGLFAEEFYRNGLQVFAVDPNPEMVIAAKSFLPNIEIKVASAENLPFESNAFHLVFMGFVLHEVDDYSLVMKEAYRVASMGVAILEWDFTVEDFGPPLEHRLKEEFVRELAQKAGFDKAEVLQQNGLKLYKFFKS